MVSVTPWLLRPPSNARARVRLFCFPYAGGGALIYRTWQARLPASVEVNAVQLPGRGNRMREQPFTRLEPLVRAATDALRPYMDMPFAFFGHSMGALISFEMARLLRREYDLMPSHLFLSGRRAPQLPDTEPITYNLPEAEFLDELHHLGGTPKEVLEHPELIQLMIPILRADFEVCQTYQHRSEQPLACPITVFGGLQDEEADRESLEGWREHTSSEFSLHMLPGDHFFLNISSALLLRSLSMKLHYVPST